jgi:hypothetical protein
VSERDEVSVWLLFLLSISSYGRYIVAENFVPWGALECYLALRIVQT